MKTNYVFLLDTNKVPQAPIHPREARRLLKEKKAAVFRQYPFTLILKRAVDRIKECIPVIDYELKIDPGSKHTGLALVRKNSLNKKDIQVVWAAEINHRGYQIKDALEKRNQMRRGRRNRKTRYRRPPILNRGARHSRKGWLPPSLMHRVYTTTTWVDRIMRFTPVNSLALEWVKFDTQKMRNPEIQGVEYQQGTLQGYEVREYLLEKFNRTCAYCGANPHVDKKDIRLEVDHVHPRSLGGSDSLSNLVLSCHKCNQKKSNKPVEEFLKAKPDVLKKIKVQLKSPLKDAAMVNATRKKLANTLEDILSTKLSTGGKTKYNRTRFNLPKAHWIDASCVGDVDKIILSTNQPLIIDCTGWGNRKMGYTDKYGFPRKTKSGARQLRARKKFAHGFSTGDIVIATPRSGKNKGKKFIGRINIRQKGSFDLKNKTLEKPIAVNPLYCKAIHRNDGYAYRFS